MKNRVTIKQMYQYMSSFGLIHGLKLTIKLALIKKIVRISLPGIPFPVSFRPDTSDLSVFRQIFIFKHYEIKVISGLDPKFIIDAGANAGYSSIFFSIKFPRAKIISLEPENSNYKMLQLNTRQYSNITTINSALWHTNTYMNIKNKHANQWSFQVQENVAGVKDSIPTTTMQELIALTEGNGIDILKIDIEGAEKDLFESEDGWLSAIKVIIIELHDHIKRGASKVFYKSLEPYQFQQYNSGENLIIFLDGKVNQSN